MGSGIGHTQFEAVYTQYYARFVIIARRYVRDVAVAEDIVMESIRSLNACDPQRLFSRETDDAGTAKQRSITTIVVYLSLQKQYPRKITSQ